MSRKKKPQTLPELYAAKEEAEDELRKAKHNHGINQNEEVCHGRMCIIRFRYSRS